jgi:GT2 family glycosyltransferase
MNTDLQGCVFSVILNYQSCEDSYHCFNCVRESDYTNVRILVVDNDSRDGSGEYLKNLIPPQCFRQFSENLGYAGGNNAAIKVAIDEGASYVFILNPDVRLDKGVVSECVRIFEADPTIGAINPVQLQEDGVTIDRKFSNAVLRSCGYGDVRFSQESLPPVIDAGDLLGAALIIPVRVIKQVGGFDPLYFAYGEETDLCRRLRFHGYRLVVAGGCAVRHTRSKERAGVPDRILFLRLKGEYLGMLKEPRRGFVRSLRLLTIRFWGEVSRRDRDHYPFNQYAVTSWHALRAFSWVLARLPKIWIHRRLEIRGRAHV